MKNIFVVLLFTLLGQSSFAAFSLYCEAPGASGFQAVYIGSVTRNGKEVYYHSELNNLGSRSASTAFSEKEISKTKEAFTWKVANPNSYNGLSTIQVHKVSDGSEKRWEIMIGESTNDCWEEKGKK